MNDRELLEALFAFLKERTFIVGDEVTIKDMVLRYKQPPLTMYHQVAMQLTLQEFREFGRLLKKVDDHLKAETTEDAIVDPA